jgi:delta 1-pyrroline-5-carboxylate dehydrogenase
MLGLEQALEAVAAAAADHRRWATVDLEERRAGVSRCVDQLETHQELLALLLIWEIGKPWHQALTSMDRTVSGVRWYLEEIEPMLAGDAVIAKTPTDGGLCALTLVTACMRRCDLPVTLVSGSGSRLSPASWCRPTSATCWSRRASTPGGSGSSATGRAWPGT